MANEYIQNTYSNQDEMLGLVHLQRDDQLREAKNYYYYRAVAHREVGNYEQAVLDMSVYIQATPTDQSAILVQQEMKGLMHLRRGDIYYSKKAFAAAIIEYNKAILLMPYCKSMYYCRAVSHRETGDYEKAILDMSVYVQATPTDQSAILVQQEMKGLMHIKRGDTYHSVKDFAAAIIEYNQAILLVPYCKSVYYYRAIIHYELGNYQQASSDIQIYIKEIPTEKSAIYLRNKIHKKLSEGYVNHGNALLNEKNFQGAIDAYNTAISLLPTVITLDIYYYRAKAHLALCDYKLALNDIKLYRQIIPKDKKAKQLQEIIEWKISLSTPSCRFFRTLNRTMPENEIKGIDINKRNMYIENINRSFM